MFLRRIRTSFAFAALAVLCLCFYSVASRGQSTTQGAIAGTVLDASGAAVPGAAITLHNDGTNAEFRLTADASGYFKAPLVPPGTYTVTVTMASYGTYNAKAVPVTVGSLTELHPELKTGSTLETVEVTGVAPVLQFESSEVSSTITSQEIVNLPLNGGRWSNLALLTPGAASDANGFGLISFRGISPILNNVEIDGADNNQAFFSEERGRTREGYSTSQIAIAEFQVNTGVYSSEYGRAAGGVLNAVTKSGTNTLHGQVYFYDRDNEWGALNPFTTLTSVNVPQGGGAVTTSTVPFGPRDWRKRWGFGAGGALIKDKLFWFYAYDQYKRNFPGVAKPSSPGAFFNQWADLALPSGATCTTASTTAKGITTVNAKFAGTGSAGDLEACTLAWRVYNGDYATAARHYNQLLFGSAVSSATGLNGPGLLDDLGTTPRTGDEVLNTPKLDWQITPTQHLSALYHRLRWDSPGGVQTQTSNNYAVDSFGTDFVKLDYGLVKLDSFISNSLSNELRVQYGRELDDEGQQPYSKFTSTYLNNSTGTPIQLGIYGGSSNNGFTAGMPYYSFRAAYPDERKTQFADTAIYSRGSHNIKFGFDVLRNTDTINNLYQSNGVYTYQYFSNFFSDILNPNGQCDTGGSETGISTNSGSAALSYPCYSGFVQGFGTPVFTLTTLDYGFFVQDDWKMTPHLTLNMGLRYDNEQVPAPFQSLISSSLLNVAIGGSGPYPFSQAQITNQPVDNNNFGPRVGVSWDPFGRGKTVVHAGYGLYYGRIPNGIVLNAFEAAGSPKGQYTIPSIKGNLPGSTVPVFPQVIGSGKFPTPGLNFFAKNFQNPQVGEFDLSVQQELGRGTYVSVSYMGALGRELPNFLNINLNSATTYQNTLTVIENPKNPGTGCGPVACGTQITSTVYSKNYVNTHYGNVTEIVSNINSSYNGAIAEIQNRSNKYVQFDANYTFSHALDFNQNQSTSPSTNNWYDPLGNPRANYGNSNFNVPNRFVTWALVQYPGHSNTWMRYVTDGWHFNPILQWQNGLPYSAGVSGTQASVSGPNNTTISANGSGMNGSGTSGYLLQIGRNTYKMPNTTVLDMRLQKDLRVSERLNLELLGEVFNVLNHQNVTSMNATAYSINATASSTTPANTLVYQPSQGAGINASGFGTVSNSNSNFVYSQRQIQLGIKLDF
jgi:Carboxypeptidase regulatory-like domain